MSKGKTIDINKLALWHHVASIPYLGPVRFQKLFTSLHGDIGRIFELKASDLDSLTGIVTTQVKIGIELVREKREASLLFAKAQTAIAQEVGARILLLDDPEFQNTSASLPSRKMLLRNLVLRP